MAISNKQNKVYCFVAHLFFYIQTKDSKFTQTRGEI